MPLNMHNASPTYKGNPSLTRALTPVVFTPEQVFELIKCKDDPIYFIENYVKITTVDEGYAPFKMYDYQKDFINIIHNKRFTIGLMSRQMGKSTTLAAYILHYIIFNHDVTCGLLAQQFSTAVEIFSKVTDAFQSLPAFMKHGVIAWNTRTIVLDNGSTAFCAATSPKSLRGRTVNLLLLDEFAFVNNAEEFMASAYPVISSGNSTKVVIISTPAGDNMFKQLWFDALESKNEYTPFKAIWRQHPNRDAEWERITKKNIGESVFRTEMDCEFAGSSGTLIDGWMLDALKPADPIAEDTYYCEFEKPDPSKLYVLVADVAEGVGRDASTVVVFDVTNMEAHKVVATYSNNTITPEIFPGTIASIGTRFNEALVIIENNSVGRSVGVAVYETFEYANTLLSKTHNGAVTYMRAGCIPGIRTTTTIKKLGCATMKRAIETKQLIVNDARIIKQLGTFIIQGNGKFGAERGANDDLITPLWLMMYFSTSVFFKNWHDDMIDA